MGVTPVTFEVRYYYIHSTAFDRVESCVRVRHHRHDRASHSDRLMRHAAHVRLHLIAHIAIAPLHACSRSRSRVQASAREAWCIPTGMLTRGTYAEASPRLPRRRAMRARTPISKNKRQQRAADEHLQQPRPAPPAKHAKCHTPIKEFSTPAQTS